MSDNAGSVWPEQEAIENWFDEFVRDKYKIFHSNANLLLLKEAVTKPRVEIQQQLAERDAKLHKWRKLCHKHEQEILDLKTELQTTKLAVSELVSLIHEMNEYLSHGHGTSIGCGSIFHQQLKELATKHGGNE